MALRGRTAALALLLACSVFAGAKAEQDSAQQLFDEAIQADLSGDGGAAEAFALFRRAGEKGHASAEFNTAVMLDSGRGTATDRAQAALWYARSASHGNKRAAFNLGQLYEAGEGVPRNVDLARAWYEASLLPAASARAAALASRERGSVLAPPVCVDPRPGAEVTPAPDGVEFVWRSAQQPEPVRFFLEVRDASGQEQFASYTDVSSALVPTRVDGTYRWRVSVVATREARYLACDWSAFTVKTD